MTSKQYSIIMDLFHEFNSDFHLISEETKNKFFAILWGNAKFTDSN